MIKQFLESQRSQIASNHQQVRSQLQELESAMQDTNGLLKKASDKVSELQKSAIKDEATKQKSTTTPDED